MHPTGCSGCCSLQRNAQHCSLRSSKQSWRQITGFHSTRCEWPTGIRTRFRTRSSPASLQTLAPARNITSVDKKSHRPLERPRPLGTTLGLRILLDHGHTGSTFASLVETSLEPYLYVIALELCLESISHR